jgi:arylsulfatase A-like enzyme|tara:strand:- start:3245 stop:4735 length:1491 start_codon:yes stop_codon:yes gene_type:complete
MKKTLFSWLLLFAVVLPLANPPCQAAAKPNMLFIAIDDLNDWVGCLDGHSQARTPNIDRLAKRGTLFVNAHCQGPICGPSRASLLSGYYPHVTGIYQQPAGKAMEKDKTFFHGQMVSHYFADHGYRTLAVGKITHGYPAKLAFDSYGGKFAGSGPKPSGGRRFNYHLPNVPWTGTQTDWGAFPDREEEMSDHKSADWAVERLAEESKQPFFLAVGFVRPHVPFYVPQKWFDLFPLGDVQLPPVRNDDLLDVPEISRRIHELPKYPGLAFLQKNDNEQFRKCVQAYLACVAFVDHQVGRVLDALDKGPHAADTVVVLFSDHGYHLGEKDRVSKHSLWEESTRVPLVVAPAKSQGEQFGKAGQLCSKPVGLIDLYPTMLQMCGLPAKKSNQGDSLVALLKNPSANWRFSTLSTYARGNHTLRSERYRYLRFEDGSEELYDHAEDPNEWTNLATRLKYAKLLKQFRKELPAKEAPYHSSVRSGAVNAWFEEHLRRHGVK